ncbi:UNVERIFIED_CONTAM: dense granule protein GRA4 [Hammondia hammondi]|eukprot:XP_008885921.1 dense granule protein GRA4 [Hammondia hammondi]
MQGTCISLFVVVAASHLACGGVYIPQVVPGTPGHPVQAIPQQPFGAQASATYYHPAAAPPPGSPVFVFTPSSLQPEGAEVTSGYSGLQLRQSSRQYGYSYPGTTTTPAPLQPASYGYPVYPEVSPPYMFSDSHSVTTEDMPEVLSDTSSPEFAATPATETASASEEEDKTSKKSKLKKGVMTGLGVAATLAAAAAAARAVKRLGGTGTPTEAVQAEKTELDDGYRPPPFNPGHSPYSELLQELRTMRQE